MDKAEYGRNLPWLVTREGRWWLVLDRATYDRVVALRLQRGIALPEVMGLARTFQEGHWMQGEFQRDIKAACKGVQHANRD